MIEFFSEVGSNFISKENGPNINRAFNLIDESARIGCTGVKFQYFKADHLWDKNKFPNEYKAAKERELPLKWIPALSHRARQKKLLFGLSVFDESAIDDVIEFVDYFKIASFEIGLQNLINKCYSTEKRLMISTGQCNQADILKVLAKLPSNFEHRIDILHCVSKYPAHIKDCNFNFIKENPLYDGWSDHTTERAAIFAAVNAGLEVIEFHLDDGLGIETEHSWTAWCIGTVIETVRDMEIAMGSDQWSEIEKTRNYKYKANSKTGLRG